MAVVKSVREHVFRDLKNTKQSFVVIWLLRVRQYLILTHFFSLLFFSVYVKLTNFGFWKAVREMRQTVLINPICRWLCHTILAVQFVMFSQQSCLPDIVNNENRPVRHYWEKWGVIVWEDLHVSDTNLLVRATVQHWVKRSRRNIAFKLVLHKLDFHIQLPL